MTAKRLRLGLIGLGSMGRSHITNIQGGKCPGVELTALCDRVPAALDGYRGSAYQLFEDPAALLASGSVDGVLIATPHYDHVIVGVAALAAGKHVLTEKPIAVHKADAEILIAAARARPELRFAAMFNQRTDPIYKKIKHLITSGELGAIRRITWIITDWFRTQAYYDSGDWRATWSGEGGGVLLNQCPHNLDLLQWLGGMPERVHAFIRLGQWHDIEVEDDVTAYLQYPGGATGTFLTTTGEAPGTNRLEIAAERGRVVAEGGKLRYTRNEVPMGDYCRTSQERFAKPPVWECEIPLSGGNGGQHAEVLQNFAQACLDPKVQLIAPGEEGIRSVELANAMIQSGLTGQAVNLPMSGASYQTLLQNLIANSTRRKAPSATAASSAEEMAKSFAR